MSLSKKINNLLQELHSLDNGRADNNAQCNVINRGVALLSHKISKMHSQHFVQALIELNNYAENLARSGIADISDDIFTFADVMDDDGLGNTDIPIKAILNISNHNVHANFSDTARQG